MQRNRAAFKNAVSVGKHGRRGEKGGYALLGVKFFMDLHFGSHGTTVPFRPHAWAIDESRQG